ncbi:hypothetical protein I4U23_013111 [Adineta vaga]|nr:hypothetical protein I4U23_013111 [Adineta vaga]
MTTKSVTMHSHDQPLHVDIELDSSDLKTSGPRLVCLVKNDWINKKISFKELTDGLSNQMIVMYPPEKDEQGVVIRTYGKNSDLIVDRQIEIQTMVKLSQYHMANEILCTFNNGLLYTFLPGEQISMDDDNIDFLVATKLAQYHSVPSDDDNETKEKSQFVEKLRHYTNLLNGTNPQLRERLETMKPPAMGVLDTIKTTIGLQSSPLSFDSLEVFLDYSWSQLDDDLQQIESILKEKWSNIPIVLCHNDTQSRNFLFDKETNTTHIIDFEHSFRNLYLYDIENYFVEFAGLESSPDWTNKYPTKERRLKFLTEYVKHTNFLSDQTSVDELTKLCDRCHCLKPLIHLYWYYGLYLKLFLIPKH